LYTGHRTPYFELNNVVAYSKYQIAVTACVRNGSLNCRISSLVIASEAASSITLTASSIAAINDGTGFRSTDVGRLIRLKGGDAYWRYAKITAVSSTTVITVSLKNGPFSSLDTVSQWRLGYWSDTTGWPTTALFFDDRLWLAGSKAAPDLVAYTTPGGYSPLSLNMSPTTEDGEVLATNGGVVRLNSAKLGAVQWMEADEKGLQIGTLNGEWVLSQITTNETLSATNLRARQSTKRGSANVNAVKIDKQVLFTQRGKRNVYEFAFNYEADGYKAPLMSVYASSLMTRSKGIEQCVYAAEPHSLVWYRMSDGTLLSLTYNRDENVIAWFEHDVGGFVEWIEVLPAPDDARDDLWLMVKRTINGVTRRYVERLKPFWDFGNTISDAFFVDCGLRYQGAEVRELYGLGHLEGESVMLLVDGVPDGPFTVASGRVSASVPGADIVVGKGFVGEGETSRLEAGARDGTAQGKLKRVAHADVLMWDSRGGLLGTFNDDTREVDYAEIGYTNEDYTVVEEAELYTQEVRVGTATGFGKRGTMWFKRPEDSPLPFNIVRINPRVLEQDGA
jgi:hypothetical protein